MRLCVYKVSWINAFYLNMPTISHKYLSCAYTVSASSMHVQYLMILIMEGLHVHWEKMAFLLKEILVFMCVMMVLWWLVIALLKNFRMMGAECLYSVVGFAQTYTCIEIKNLASFTCRRSTNPVSSVFYSIKNWQDWQVHILQQKMLSSS